MKNAKRRELTAAEIDVVGGGGTFENILVSGYNLMDAAYLALRSGSAGRGNGDVSAMYDIRQNDRAV